MVDRFEPDPAVMARAGALIRADRLVAFPTETVYGLGANALSATAVAALFAAKGRPANDPVIVHLADEAQLDLVATAVGPLARRLIEAFWPGPLTLVLPRADAVPAAVSAGLPSVAVRLPAHAVAQALIRAARVPIAAPSANLFSRPSATTAAHVVADLGDRVDLILDAGPAPIGLESTILAVTGARPRLLRPGGVPLEAIEALIGPVERAATATVDDEAAQLAPGLLSKHYSPRARLSLVIGEPAAARRRLRQELEELHRGRQRLGALLVNEDAEVVAGLPIVVGWLGSEQDLATVAERLFAAMREVDAAGVAVIGARSLGSTGLGLAILDRLTRAAAGRVIDLAGVREPES